MLYEVITIWSIFYPIIHITITLQFRIVCTAPRMRQIKIMSCFVSKYTAMITAACTWWSYIIMQQYNTIRPIWSCSGIIRPPGSPVSQRIYCPNIQILVRWPCGSSIFCILTTGIRSFRNSSGNSRITSYNVCYTKLLREFASGTLYEINEEDLGTLKSVIISDDNYVYVLENEEDVLVAIECYSEFESGSIAIGSYNFV